MNSYMDWKANSTLIFDVELLDIVEGTKPWDVKGKDTITMANGVKYIVLKENKAAEKAAKELSRILAPHGNLYISVPIDDTSKVYFNAHRAFTRDYILLLFNNLKLIEEKYIYGRETVSSYEKSKGFGTGLYHFKK